MSELTHSKKISGLFASFAVIVLLGGNLAQTLTVTESTMVFVFVKVIPAAILMGYLGHLIGSILDNPRKKQSNKK